MTCSYPVTVLATVVSVSNELTQSDAIILVAEGVDTVSTISINGQEVGRTDNMFVKYSFDIRSFIKVKNISRVSDQNGVS